jgi:hypothetical protein
MTSLSVEPLRTAFGVGPEWLWTWNGICFGYRRGDSLFTYDGFEVGRFSGTEVYAADGRYLGELTSAADGGRLITNLYKKSRSVRGFVPTFDHAYNRPPNRAGQPLYSGHEDFPSPSQMKSSAF